MRFRLLTFPQQIVLRDGADWISVDDVRRYFEVLRRHVPSVRGQLVYIAAGFLFETAFTVSAGVVLRIAGFKLFAVIVVGLSLLFYLVYLFIMDLPHARRHNEPWGDSTLMYSKAPVLATCWSIGMIVVRLGLAASLLWL